MLDNFVTHTLAKKLRDKGFNKPCFSKFTDVKETKKQCEISTCTIPEVCFNFKDNKRIFGRVVDYNSEYYKKEGTFSAPTYEQAINWFWETYQIGLCPYRDHRGMWFTITYDETTKSITKGYENGSYQSGVINNWLDCKSQCIEEALKLI